MTDLITSFRGRYAFLSNFNHTPFTFGGHDWPTAEHCFQAQKSTTLFDFQKIRQAASPGEAKKLGRTIAIREGWDGMKREIMLRILLEKFTSPDLIHQLAATMPAHLIEGNTWHDLYWGAVRYGPGVTGPLFQADDRSMWCGHNWLGRLLMVVREVKA